MKKYILSTILLIILLAITYFLVLQECDFNLLINSFRQTKPFYLFLSALTVFGYIFLGAFFLKRILKHFNYKVSMPISLGYMFTEIYFSAITPSYVGGQPVQMMEMKKEDVPYEVSSVVVLFNSMMNRVSLILIATLLFIFFGKTIFTLKGIYNVLVILGYVSTLLVIFFFWCLIYSPKVTNWLLKLANYLIDHLKFIKKKKEAKDKLAKALEDYKKCATLTRKNPKIVRESLIILLFQRLFLLLTSYFVYLSFGLNHYSLFLVIAFQVCVTLGSDLMPTPGGVMVNEGLLLVVNKLLYGEDLALSGMLMLRSFTFYFLVIISGIAYFIFHHRSKKSC